jgi:ABC-2 type transport system permease protein
MLTNVFMKTLRDQRRSLIWWAVGLVALVTMTLLFYPSFRDSPEFDEIYEQMPEWLAQAFAGEFSDFTSPEGFLNSQLFFFVLPLLFIIFTVAGGSGAIAGEEARGTLGLLLATPVARWTVVVHKFGAIAVATLALGVVLWVALVVGAAAVDMEIGSVRLAAATLSSVLLGIAFGGVALALGCARGDRGTSIGTASALGVASYFLNALAPLADSLEPLQRLSPFYYYIESDPLSNGLNLAHATLLVVIALAALAFAVVSFERRDLRA